VTFHIEDGSVLDRRTLVMKRESGEWKIAHIHRRILKSVSDERQRRDDSTG
jgi:hypothetical protein